MGRIRTIKPEFFQSESLGRVSRDARLTFIGLWTEADDHGRGVANAKVICGHLWPLDDDVTPGDVEEHLQALSHEHITLYEVDGKRYYEVVNWEDHQAAAYRRGPAVHPRQNVVLGTTNSCAETCGCVLEQGTGNREQGTGNREAPQRAVHEASFARFWETYPLRVAKDAAVKAWSKALERSPADEIIAGAERYRDDPNRDDGFTKHPATWLNAGCWADDPLPARRSSAPVRAPTAARNADRVTAHFDRIRNHSPQPSQPQPPALERGP